MQFIKRLYDPTTFLKKVKAVGDIPKTRDIYLKTVKTAWPSVLEAVLLSLVSIVDTIMVGTLGDAAIAAVGLTTQPKFLGLAVFMATSMGVLAIISRRKGEGKRKEANAILKQVLLAVSAIAIAISAISIIFAPEIMSLAGANEDTLAMSTTFFRYVAAGFLFNAITLVICAAQRGIGNTKVAMITNTVANLVNVVLNYLLIGGNLGFPRMEIAGAALATTIGSGVACILAIGSLLNKNNFLYINLKEKLFVKVEGMGNLIKVALSAGVEQICMRIGFISFALIIANLGTLDFATHQIVMNITFLSFSFGDGLSNAASSLIGRSLGEKRPDLAIIYGKAAQRIAMPICIILCIIFSTCGTLIIDLFSDDSYVIHLGGIIMNLNGLIVLLQINHIILSGCLRGAGDTRYTAFISFVSITIIRPILAYILCYPLGLGLFGAWVGMMFDQVCRFALSSTRYASAKWIKLSL